MKIKNYTYSSYYISIRQCLIWTLHGIFFSLWNDGIQSSNDMGTIAWRPEIKTRLSYQWEWNLQCYLISLRFPFLINKMETEIYTSYGNLWELKKDNLCIYCRRTSETQHTFNKWQLELWLHTNWKEFQKFELMTKAHIMNHFCFFVVCYLFPRKITKMSNLIF